MERKHLFTDQRGPNDAFRILIIPSNASNEETWASQGACGVKITGEEKLGT